MFRGPRAGLRHSAAVVVAVVPLLAAAVPSTVRADEQLDGALATMARMMIVESPAEWREQAVKGRFCDGSRVDDLLQRLAGAFEPVKSRDEALAVLSRKKIIWNDSWREQAVSRRQCEGEYVATLLRVAAAPLADQELIASQAVPDGILVCDEPTAFATASTSSGSGGFNAVIGTQTFDPSYRFTRKPRLVETAEAIRGMGGDTIKFQLSPTYARGNGNVDAARGDIRSLADLVRDEPAHRAVLDMPFSRFVLWAHTFHLDDSHDRWRKGLSAETAAGEYREIYDLARHLLGTYRGTGKTFYLGHWEGDGLLRGSIDAANDARADEIACRGMADWLTARQRAVDDAKRDTPHDGVQVWHYTEVNHVRLAMQGRPAVVTRVLPLTNVDLVSYSCYDTQDDPRLLKAALSFIEKQLPPKPGIAGRRVFIGEYGFPAIRHTPRQQDRLARQVIRAGLEWGAPLILYWELYNNEVEADGRQRGYWLIDDKGVKQPVYDTHASFLAWARDAAAATKRQSGRPPSAAEFRAAAIDFLDAAPAAAEE
jgi:hypothetical protein